MSQINIDDLLAMWSEDAKVDPTNLSGEVLRISQLHAKYLAFMSHHSLMVKSMTTKYNRMKKIKWEYYRGDLNNPEDLKQYGYEPFTKKLDYKQDIQIYLDADEELTNILIKKQIHQETVDVCTLILKELHSRTFQIKSSIEQEKFMNGIN